MRLDLILLRAICKDGLYANDSHLSRGFLFAFSTCAFVAWSLNNEQPTKSEMLLVPTSYFSRRHVKPRTALVAVGAMMDRIASGAPYKAVVGAFDRYCLWRLSLDHWINPE